METKEAKFVENVFVGIVGVPLAFLGLSGLWVAHGR